MPCSRPPSRSRTSIPCLACRCRSIVASLNQKLLVERRGGYCFELNLTFLRVLQELGFDARGHLAGVLWGGRPVDELAPDHMLLTVDIAGTTYLADVGFGGMMMTAPLKLKTDIEQETPLGTYRLVGEDPALRLDIKRRDEEWRPVYQFALDAIEDDTYATINTGLNADPDWFFHHHLLVERAPATGRRLLFDSRLTSFGEAGREITPIGSVGELRDTLATEFGIGLATLDGVDDALAGLLAREPAVP